MSSDKAEKEKVPNRPQPKDVQVIQAIMKDMGVPDYEPAVINQLLDFAYKYTSDVLDDAKSFSSYGNKKMIDVDDVKLAVQLKLDRSYTNPPPRELLLDIAGHRNTQTLPLIKPYTGPKLPADRYCLSAVNYKLKSKKPSLIYNPQTGFSTAPLHRQNSQSKPGVSLVNRPVLRASAPPVPTVRAVPPQPAIVQTSAGHLTPASVLGSLGSKNRIEKLVTRYGAVKTRSVVGKGTQLQTAQPYRKPTTFLKVDEVEDDSGYKSFSIDSIDLSAGGKRKITDTGT